jgi:hypothetical protein
MTEESDNAIADDNQNDENPSVAHEGKAILKEIEELREKVWWNRHQNKLAKIESGRRTVTEAELPYLMKGVERAKEIEAKYGIDNLGWDDFEWGMLNGKLSALRWVMGSDWDDLQT